MTLPALVHGDDRVMNVRTGELLDLREANAEDVAQGREGLTALRHEVDDAAVLYDAEIVARVDAAIHTGEIDKYTVQIGNFEVKVPSPEAGGKVDAAALRDDLLSNAKELGLTVGAINNAFKTRTTYTLNRSVFSTLAKQEPLLEALLKRHTGPPERRRATVTTLPGKDARTTVGAPADSIEGHEAFPF